MKDARVFCSECSEYKPADEGCKEHDLPALTDAEIEDRCIYRLHGEDGYR